MDLAKLRESQLRHTSIEIRVSTVLLVVFPLIAVAPWIFPATLEDPAIVNRVGLTVVSLLGAFGMLVWMRLAQVSRDYWREH